LDKETAKAHFIARATRHFDTPQIRMEAEELFEQKWAESHPESLQNDK